jgi:hypothetical protein
MSSPRSLAKLAVGLGIASLISACASSSATSSQTTSSGSTGGKTCNEPCILFTVNFTFTGLDNINGSFVDNESGTGLSSCSEFAKGDSVGFAQGPGTPHNLHIDGKFINFLFDIGHDKFHGPGTYSGTLAAGGVTIGNDTFLSLSGNASSSETLNADGSGHGSFNNLSGGSSTGTQGMESGTLTWTCSK